MNTKYNSIAFYNKLIITETEGLSKGFNLHEEPRIPFKNIFYRKGMV